MMIDKKYDHDLVTEDYYKKELSFQAGKEKEDKTIEAGMNVDVQTLSQGVEFVFPNKIQGKKVQGFLFFYRPSDKTLDFNVPIALEDNKMLVTSDKLAKGRWNVDVNYVVEGEEYLTTKKDINLK